MVFESLKNLLSLTSYSDYSKIEPENPAAAPSSLEALREESAKDTTVDNKWYYTDSINNKPHQQIEEDAKKASPYYNDTLKSLDQKIQADQIKDDFSAFLGSSKKPVSPYYQDTLAPADSTLATDQIDRVEELSEDAKDAQVFNNLMSSFIDEAKEADAAGELDFATLMKEIFKLQIEAQDEQSTLTREQLVKHRTDRQKLNKERLDRMDDLLSRAQQTKTWTRFQQAATTFQLAATALGVSTGWGLVAFILVAGLAADQMADDYVKKGIANVIARGDKESAQWWTGALQLGTGLIAMCASFTGMTAQAGATLQGADKWSKALGLGAEKWFKATMSGMQATTSAMKGYTEYQRNGEQADMYKLSDDITQKDKKIKSAIEELQRMYTTQCNLYRDLSRQLKTQAETVSAIFSK